MTTDSPSAGSGLADGLTYYAHHLAAALAERLERTDEGERSFRAALWSALDEARRSVDANLSKTQPDDFWLKTSGFH